ncbi:gamma-glutamylcyclotransferase [Luteolibacter flavescens]|uniref:Gamma-glutamylcyclotransferase n=1 Tax=Luteolibacter flavescens TaxID=1859460 RepID=A0ABT3FWA9_9BACT|nr:gamma-glutamylcyclotransferase [Luteolibacter flavescens]MCW1887837.1 gamma-glutamylcyclotransferase [Luteolibacter flavescens]
MSDAPSDLLFVFGRLRRGGADAFRMEGAEFFGEATVQGSLYRLPEGPVFVAGELTMPRVTGEIYRIAPGHLDRLDGGVPTGNHQRIKVTAHSVANMGQSWEAWTWEWRGAVDASQVIRSGDWFEVESPGFAVRLPLYPLFTWIGLFCFLCFPVLMLMASVATPRGMSPVAQTMIGLASIGGLLAPFASVYALWLAKRRGESDFMFGCLFWAAIVASAMVTFFLLEWLVGLIRG